MSPAPCSSATASPRVILLVRIHDGHQVVLALGDHPVEVIHATPPAADLDAVQFAARVRRGEEIGEWKEVSGGQRAGGQRGALEKRAAVQGKVHNQERLRTQAQRLSLSRSIAGPINKARRACASEGNKETGPSGAIKEIV